MQPEEKLKELGLELPVVPIPLGNYVPFVQTGNLIFTSGLAPFLDGRTAPKLGRLGRDLNIEEGYQASRLACLNGLAIIKAAIGDLGRVKRVVKVVGYVNGTEDFTDQPKVVNGASDLLVEVFGDKGRHARSAVGVAQLPIGLPVEIELVVEV